MKILVLCNHGNVRSVGLAYLIKTIYNHDTLSAGVEENSKETLSMLFEWSEKIICLTPEAYKFVKSSSFQNAATVDSLYIDVGKDVWHNPFAQELQHKLLKHLKEFNL